jgi:putative radical SAM enzyme (TIGR03279 family)
VILLERAPTDGLLPGYSWREGDRLSRIGTSTIEDILDFYYLGEDAGELEIVIMGRDDQVQSFHLDADRLSLLAESFAPLEFKTCACRCVFCFIDQNPPGMRDPIYVKDEDYRLSFLYGNYITLTSLGRRGLRRVLEQKLSPLFVSVHATDLDTRTKLLGIKRRIDVLAILRELTTHGIEVHCQIVLCPGWNDKEILDHTLRDLGELADGVASIAIVPVGLSDHREGLVKLRPVEKEDALALLRQTDSWQERFLSQHGQRLVYASDEFYLRAELPFPPLSFYEDLPQEDNGIGQARGLLEELREGLPRLVRAGQGQQSRATILTGILAAEFFEREVVPLLAPVDWLDLRIVGVSNRLYGKGITVAGLLPGRDFATAIAQLPADCGQVLLPDAPLNHEDLFLDDMPLHQLLRESSASVTVARDGLLEALLELTGAPLRS